MIDYGVYLPSAAPSPRISGGTLKWCAGDTFELVLRLALTDADGCAVEIGDADTVHVRFFDGCMRPVHSFACADIADNTVTLRFDEDVTALFPRGAYSYDVCLEGARRVTLARNNPAVVE